jgi:hypothetical protein
MTVEWVETLEGHGGTQPSAHALSFVMVVLGTTIHEFAGAV